MATTYTVSWDWLDGDTGTLPGTFATECEAEAVGSEWVAEMNDDDACYWIYRHEAQRDGSTRVYDEDDKFVRMIPA